GYVKAPCRCTERLDKTRTFEIFAGSGRQARRWPTTGRSRTIEMVECLAVLESLFQQGRELPLLFHRLQNVGVPVELPVDEDLGQRRPVGHLRQGLPLGRIGQDVDDFVRIPVPVEKLHRLAGEPAHRHRLGTLAVDQNFMFFDLLLDLFLDWISHNASLLYRLQDAQKGHPTRPQGCEDPEAYFFCTLRGSSDREQSWGPFSASCYEPSVVSAFISTAWMRPSFIG